MVNFKQSTGRSLIKKSFWSLVISAVIISGLGMWSHFRYGSLRLGLSAAVGRELSVENSRLSFGSLDLHKQKVVSFSLHNLSNRPTTIIGSQSNCSCTYAQQLPIVIPARGHRSISISYTASTPGEVNEQIRLFTDNRTVPQIVLTVTGRNIDNHEGGMSEADTVVLEPIP